MARADINDHIIDTHMIRPTVEDLHPLVMDEVLWALKVKDRPFLRWLVNFLATLPVKKFTRLIIEFENAVGDYGPAQGAQMIFKYFFDDLKVMGRENIPDKGPVILAANHPGGMDFIAEVGLSCRDDIRIISSDVNFLRPLPVANQYLVPVTADPKIRFKALKETLAHLEQGGALLLYPSGSIDPDPQFFRNAKEHLSRWSRSLEAYLRKVPEVQFVPIITSNALNERFLFNKLVMSQKYRLERQRAAEFLQTLNMMFLKGKRLDLQISIGKPVQFPGLKVGDKDSIRQAKLQLQTVAENLFEEHLLNFPATRSELWLEKEAVFQH